QRVTKNSQALTRADLVGIRFFCGKNSCRLRKRQITELFADILFAKRNSETSGIELVHSKLVKRIFLNNKKEVLCHHSLEKAAFFRRSIAFGTMMIFLTGA